MLVCGTASASHALTGAPTSLCVLDLDGVRVAAAAVDDGAEVEDIPAKMFPDGVGRLAQFFQRFPAEGYQFFSGAGTASEHPGKEG